MALLKALLWPVQAWNDVVLGLGRWVAIICIALMVAAILVQVFFRYVLDNALPWPDEAARFLMLWMTGVIAPLAFRRGGFVAIDMVVEALPRATGQVLALLLLLISAGVLVVAIPIGLNELTGFNARFATSSLRIPVSLDFSEWMKVPRWWMQASLFVGVVLLFIVNVELILRALIQLLGGEVRDIAPSNEEILAE